MYSSLFIYKNQYWKYQIGTNIHFVYDEHISQISSLDSLCSTLVGSIVNC